MARVQPEHNPELGKQTPTSATERTTALEDDSNEDKDRQQMVPTIISAVPLRQQIRIPRTTRKQILVAT